MTLNSESLGPSFEQGLTQEQIRHFQEKVMWGAVNYLWEGDFTFESRPGEEVSHSRTIVLEGTDDKLSLIIKANSPEDLDESPEMELTIRRRRNDLTAFMVQTFIDQDGEEEKADSYYYEAWETSTYYADYPCTGNVGIYRILELYDDSGDVVGDSDEMRAKEGDEAELTEDEKSTISDLDDSFGHCLTLEDILEIKSALEQASIQWETSLVPYHIN